jgi:hypothetical protein
MVTTQATGGGGIEYTLTFMGQNDFKDANDVQKYFSTKTDTNDDVRRGLVKALKLGLMSYVGRTPIARRIAVDYTRPENAGPGRDRWDSWVFSLTGSGYFSGEESYMSRMAKASFSSTPRNRNITSRTRSSPVPSPAGTGAASTSRAWANTGRPECSSRPNPPSTATSTSA